MDLLAKSQSIKDLKCVLTLNVFNSILLPEITSVISELDDNWTVAMELPSKYCYSHINVEFYNIWIYLCILPPLNGLKLKSTFLSLFIFYNQ